MSEISSIKLAEGLYSIEHGYVRSFLVEGDKEALLIDTGIGGNHLKAYLQEITKLPITVVFTHADRDHIGDMGDFEKRRMHPSEFDYYQGKVGNAYPMEPIWEEDIIDLGTYRFEVILLPGHTPGSIALLEKEKRFLIGGDSVQTGRIFMFGNGRNFYAYRASLRKLQGRMHEFDIVYASHDTVSVDPDTINKLYHVAGMVMDKKIEGKEGEFDYDEKVKLYQMEGVAFYAY